MFATNVTGLINLTQAILPIFQKRPNGGQGDIINIGSIAGMSLLIYSTISALKLHHYVSSKYISVLRPLCFTGREPYPGGSIYCATKAAVRSFTESLRKELIATRIRVIEVDPGQVETVRNFHLGFHLQVYFAHTITRNSPLFASTATRPRLMPFMRKTTHHLLSLPSVDFLTIWLYGY